jgi:hypothetical protein
MFKQLLGFFLDNLSLHMFLVSSSDFSNAAYFQDYQSQTLSTQEMVFLATNELLGKMTLVKTLAKLLTGTTEGKS